MINPPEFVRLISERLGIPPTQVISVLEAMAKDEQFNIENWFLPLKLRFTDKQPKNHSTELTKEIKELHKQVKALTEKLNNHIFIEEAIEAKPRAIENFPENIQELVQTYLDTNLIKRRPFKSFHFTDKGYARRLMLVKVKSAIEEQIELKEKELKLLKFYLG